MENIKSYLIEFAEGRVGVPEFLEYCKKNPEVLDYLTNIADSTFKTCVIHRSIDEKGCLEYTNEEREFDAKLFIDEELKSKIGNLGIYLNIHHLFSNVLITAFPNDNIVMDETLSEKFTFMLHACPEYIGGEEVDEILENLLESLPTELSKAKKVKLYKERVKAMFHIEKNKYPRWVQSAEWPLGQNNKPMKFVEQKRKKGKSYEMMMYTEFWFEDVETGEQRVVEQFT